MSRPQKRSFQIRGHRTSLSLEQPFWEALREISSEKGKPIAGIVAEIDAERDAMASGLSSAVRVFILNHYRNQAMEAGRNEPTENQVEDGTAQLNTGHTQFNPSQKSD